MLRRVVRTESDSRYINTPSRTKRVLRPTWNPDAVQLLVKRIFVEIYRDEDKIRRQGKPALPILLNLRLLRGGRIEFEDVCMLRLRPEPQCACVETRPEQQDLIKILNHGPFENPVDILCSGNHILDTPQMVQERADGIV